MHANESATDSVAFCTLYNISSYLDLVIPLPTVHSLRFVGLDNICHEQSGYNFNPLLRPQQFLVVRLLGVKPKDLNVLQGGGMKRNHSENRSLNKPVRKQNPHKR